MMTGFLKMKVIIIVVVNLKSNSFLGSHFLSKSG